MPAQSQSDSVDPPEPWKGEPGVRETTHELMEREARQGSHPHHLRKKFESDFQEVLPNPDAPNVSAWPPEAAAALPVLGSPQTVGVSFTAATLADSAFPPDTMGAAGPS